MKKKDDSLIPKKSKWNMYNKPSFFQVEPTPPPAEIVNYKEEVLFSSDIVYDDLVVPLERLFVKDHDPKDLSVRVITNHDYDGEWTSTYLQVLKINSFLVKNPNYEKQLEKFNKDHAAWKKKKAAHESELEQWEAWVKQEKSRDLENKLKAAENLLRKHGRLKEAK